ncbi:MAG: hypothetical protein K9G59_03915 [Caulobacter sp.]|nr:hypothetical protein [Caulobacter sp.]
MRVRSHLQVAGPVLAGLLAASATPAQASMWISQSGRNPAAGIGDGKGSSVSVTCLAGRDPVYVLVVRGPARGLKPGRGIKAVIEGRRRVSFRFDSARLDPGGIIQLTSRGGYRGSTGDQSGTLEAIESIVSAKGPIMITVGGLRFSVSSLGVRWAMAPLIKACGDLKSMIKRAEAREGELN